MSSILRGWIAFAGLGSGIVHLALAVDSPAGFAIALLLVGVLQFVWGVLTMAATRLIAPRAVIAGALLPAAALWAAEIVTGGPVRALPLLVATVLELFVAMSVAVALRRGRPDGPPPSAGRYLVGLAAGALAVAAVVTPALAATRAGESAVPHGTFEDVHGH
jgi:hypothetical protein